MRRLPRLLRLVASIDVLDGYAMTNGNGSFDRMQNRCIAATGMETLSDTRKTLGSGTKGYAMNLIVKITIGENGVTCLAEADGEDAFTNAQANTLAIGALEITKASLLAHRWGINIGNMKTEAIVEEPVTPNVKVRGCGDE